MHEVDLLYIKVSTLYKANKALSKRRRAKEHVYNIEEHLLGKQDIGRQEVQEI